MEVPNKIADRQEMPRPLKISSEEEFVKKAKETVMLYANEHLDKTDRAGISEDEVFMVWYCKTLQNWKALLSTMLLDGMYYEVTVNGDKNEMYLDAYKKFENRRIVL